MKIILAHPLNASGLHTYDLLVIGKAAKPIAFKHINLHSVAKKMSRVAEKMSRVSIKFL